MRLSIVRSIGHIVDLKSYNVQEVGLGKALCDRGFDVQVYFASSDRESKKINFKRSGRVLELIFVPFIKLPGKNAIFLGVRKELKRFEPDIIQIHECTQLMSLAISLYAKFKRIPVVLYQGQYQYPPNVYSKTIQKIYDGSFGILQRSLIFQSTAKTAHAKKFLSRLGYKNITLTPVGLDVDAIDQGHKINWQKKYKMTSNTKVMLYIGILEKRRNIEFLIKLIQALPKDFVLFIAGEGPEKERCESLARKLFLEKKVIFLGQVKQSQISSLYRYCDAYLMPSEYEIYGMTMLEAMYFGAVVLSTRTAGGVSIIDDETTGILLDGLNIAEWRDVILKIIHNPDHARFLRENAKRSILKNYTWKAISVKMEKMYLEVARDS